MKPSTSFLVGVAVGVFAVLVAARTRKLLAEEDVESLKERISDSLRNLEQTVGGLAEGLSETFSTSRQ